MSEYVPDKMYYRLFCPWFLPESERHLGKEDWARVDAICDLPWKGELLDFGAGDGTLGAMVCSRNPDVTHIDQVESDPWQLAEAARLWAEWPLTGHVLIPDGKLYDGALCCEVLEHLTPEDGHKVLCDIKARLKPGALLCVTVPAEGRSREKYPGHIRSFGAWTLINAVKDAGFTLTGESRVVPEIPDTIWLMAVAHA